MSLALAACAQAANDSPMKTQAADQADISVARFHERAEAREPLRVAFLGGSVTWGANASDPLVTSYRGLMMQWLRDQYPNTPIQFFDAAIGGTNSQLALFRLERDVLAYNPDLVFLDFTVNDGAGEDDIEKYTSYETLIRHLLENDIAVMPVLLMFKWHVKEVGAEFPARHQGHLKIGEAYNLPVANTIPHVSQAVADGRATVEVLWPFDGAHPDDPGYELLFEAVRDRYAEAAQTPMPARILDEPLYGEYDNRTRLTLRDTELPKGWEVMKTYRTSLWFDGLASRWMGDVAVASKEKQSGPLEVEFEGSLVGFFGERNGLAPDVNIYIDGELIPPPKAKDGQTAWHIASDRFAPPKKGSGNLFIWNLIADDLPEGPHTLKIEPLWDDANEDSELRIESICFAGKDE
ncbi:MAG: SGNH/GDSL hydrolase family protein [Puniceicoccales bacterium]